MEVLACILGSLDEMTLIFIIFYSKKMDQADPTQTRKVLDVIVIKDNRNTVPHKLPDKAMVDFRSSAFKGISKTYLETEVDPL